MGLVLSPADRGELHVMGRTRPRSRRLIGLSALVLAVASLSPTVVARPKTDVLVMKNGDRITCEIQTLQRGQLEITTDYTRGIIMVDWSKVQLIESPTRFQVETTRRVMVPGDRFANVRRRNFWHRPTTLAATRKRRYCASPSFAIRGFGRS